MIFLFFPPKVFLAGHIIYASGISTKHAQQRQPIQDGAHEFGAVFGPGLVKIVIVLLLR